MCEGQDAEATPSGTSQWKAMCHVPWEQWEGKRGLNHRTTVPYNRVLTVCAPGFPRELILRRILMEMDTLRGGLVLKEEGVFLGGRDQKNRRNWC